MAQLDPARLRTSLKTTEIALLAVLAAVDLLFPLALFLSGWPRPWDAFFGEESPINWFSSVQCAALAVTSLAVWGMTRAGVAMGSDPVRRSWPWLVLAAGFAFLSLDEQFMIHENMREEVLKPRHWFTDVPGLYDGDVVLLVYVAAGVVLALALYADLQRHRLPLFLFAAALALIGVAAVQDALNLRLLKLPTVRHVQIVAEETGEVWAQGLFMSSLIVLFFRKLRSALFGSGRD